MKKVQIYTDGACSYNPGPGGWGSILFYQEHRKELSGFCEKTTNNRMELTAVIEAVKVLREPCELEIFTDSAYVMNAFDKGWIIAWQKNGWKTSSKSDVGNQSLWKELLAVLARHQYVFIKVKGHSDNEWNNHCDRLARAEVKRNASKGLE